MREKTAQYAARIALRVRLEDLRFVDRPFISLSPLFDRSASRLEGPACGADYASGIGSSAVPISQSRLARSALAQALRRCWHHVDGRPGVYSSRLLSLLPELPQSRGSRHCRGVVARVGRLPALPRAEYGRRLWGPIRTSPFPVEWLLSLASWAIDRRIEGSGPDGICSVAGPVLCNPAAFRRRCCRGADDNGCAM